MQHSFKPSSTQRQRGLTMIELTIVLAIGAVIISAVFMLFQRNSRKVAIKDNVSIITEIASDIKNKFGSGNQYGDLNTAVAVQSRTFPAVLQSSPTTAKNSYGGDIVVAPDQIEVANDVAKLTWSSVPSDQCVDLVNATSNVARRIAVGGTDVKPADGALNLAVLNAQCTADPMPNVDYYIGR